MKASRKVMCWTFWWPCAAGRKKTQQKQLEIYHTKQEHDAFQLDSLVWTHILKAHSHSWGNRIYSPNAGHQIQVFFRRYCKAFEEPRLSMIGINTEYLCLCRNWEHYLENWTIQTSEHHLEIQEQMKQQSPQQLLGSTSRPESRIKVHT